MSGLLDAASFEGFPAQRKEYLYNTIINSRPDLDGHPDLLYGDLELIYIRFINDGTIVDINKGDRGFTGPQGPQGIQGVQGDIGPIGPQGPIGSTGPQGIQGIKGDTGLTGSQGIQGVKGDTGLTGAQGIPGNNGADGTSVTIVGSVATSADLPTTGNVNGDGWIANDTGHLWVWNGTTFNDVGLVKGPKGDTGPQGIQGIQGNAGPIGITGNTGPQGVKGDTGAQGIQGIQGIQGDTGSPPPTVSLSGTGVDLNNYTVPGSWSVVSGSTVTNGFNFPGPYAGTLTVLAGITTAVTQFYVTYGTSVRNEYVRNLYGGTWSAWDKLTKDGDNLINIVAGTDLDTIFTSGNYIQSSTANATSALHYPISVAGRLAVWSNGGQFTFQEYTAYHIADSDVRSDVKYVRGKYSSQSWGPWKQLAEVSKVITKGELVISIKDYAAVGDGIADDTAAIQNAVTAAYNAAATLDWGHNGATYLTTANIANLHKVIHHLGSGRIKRGTTFFYPNATTTQSNTLYIATTGSATNDGLTSDKPLNTLAVAVPLLSNYGPFICGAWTFSLAAGTYTDRTVFPTNLIFASPLTIKGADVAGHPNVPTTIFSEGYNISASAIIVNDFNESITFQDLLFSGYNGTASSMGINIGNCLGTVYTVNCHFTDNYWGMSAIHSLYDMKGGILQRNGYLGDTPNTATPSTRNGNGAGSRSLMQARHSIGLQGAGDNTHGPYFLNNRTGMFVQELCTGHADWVKFEDNERAIDCSVQSRVNVDGSSFKRNGMDLKGSSNSHFYISSNNTFGVGADESDIRIALTSGAQIGDENRVFTNLLPTNATTMKVLDTQFPNQNVTATAPVVVHTVTLAGGMWRNKPNSLVSPKRIVLKITGEMFGTASNKRCIVRLGTTNVSLVFPAATQGVFEAEAHVYFTDRATQVLLIKGYNHLGSLRIARSSATNAITADTNLTTEAQVDVAGDSITIYTVDVSWGG